MKITDEDFNILKSAISPLDTEERRQFCREHHITFTYMRYRWDLMHMAYQRGALQRYVFDKHLHSYLNDDHIDTALRKIVQDPHK